MNTDQCTRRLVRKRLTPMALQTLENGLWRLSRHDVVERYVRACQRGALNEEKIAETHYLWGVRSKG